MRKIDPKDPTKPVTDYTPGGSSSGYHAIEAMLRCPKEFQLKHVRGVSVPTNKVADPLAVGAEVHAGRAEWFARGCATDGITWEAVKRAAEAVLDVSGLPVSERAHVSGLSYLRQYIDHYSKRPAPTVVDVEYGLGPAPIEPGDPLFAFRTARLDDISKYPETLGALAIGELKTCSTSVADCVNQYTLHGQPLLQYLLWKSSPNGEARHGPIRHILLDVIVKGYGKNKCVFGRQAIPIYEHSLEWYAASLRGYLKAASRIGWGTDVPRNITACTRMYGKGRSPCEFRALCQAGRSAARQYTLKDGADMVDPNNWPEDVPPWA